MLFLAWISHFNNSRVLDNDAKMLLNEMVVQVIGKNIWGNLKVIVVTLVSSPNFF